MAFREVNPQSVRPSVEELEPRIALSNVLASIVGGNLVVAGGIDADNLLINVDGLAAGEVRVLGAGGTTVNGDAAAVLSGWTGGVKASLGGGNDDLAISVPAIAGSVLVDLGWGSDVLDMTGCDTIGGSLSVKSGDGDDVVTVPGMAVARDLSFDGADGNNTVTFQNLLIGGRMTVKNGEGTDTLTIASIGVTRDISISSGDGDTTLDLDNVHGASLKITNGEGAHAIDVNIAVLARGFSVMSTRGGASVVVHDAEVGGLASTRFGAAGGMLAFYDSTLTGGFAMSGTGGINIVGLANTDVGMGARPGDVRLAGGAGVLIFQSNDLSVARNLSVSGSAASAILRNLSVGGNLSFKSGGLGDELGLNYADVTGKTSIDLGAGDDVALVDSSTFGGAFSLKMGAGGDGVGLDVTGIDGTDTSLFNGPVIVDTGSGDDYLYLGVQAKPTDHAAYASTVRLTGGSGLDLVDYVGNGNIFIIQPVVATFETIQ